MKCCNVECATKFCPHCGKKMDDPPLKQLADYLSDKVKFYTGNLEQLSAKPFAAPEKQQRSVSYNEKRLAYYSAMRDALRQALRPDPAPTKIY